MAAQVIVNDDWRSHLHDDVEDILGDKGGIVTVLGVFVGIHHLDAAQCKGVEHTLLSQG